MNHAVLLRYHEIALKGGNRSWFEERLVINARKLLRLALGPDSHLEVIRQRGRVIVRTPWTPLVEETLRRLFGISSFSPMRVITTGKETLRDAVLEEARLLARSGQLPRTFRLLTRRSEKVLPETSMELDRYFGSAVKEEFPELVVNLDEPELTIGVELHADTSYVWSRKIAGPGGLPVGTNGHLLSLLSGGLDSPVAAINILKRGAKTSFLHFYGTPFVGAEVLEKVEDLARIVNRYQPDPQPLHVVPFGKIQEKIALATHPKMRTILYRRMMIRIAGEIAHQCGAQALVTGESLGQVASQTLENIITIDQTASLPILRPLIALDKDEIIQAARSWGTYETAIRPAADCCTLFADRHPTIRAALPLIEEQESRFPVQELVAEALQAIETRSRWR